MKLDQIYFKKCLVFDLFRLSAYGCLSTGHDEGLIEVVTEARTIAFIQNVHPGVAVKKAFNKLCLYAWLRENNKTEEK